MYVYMINYEYHSVCKCLSISMQDAQVMFTRLFDPHTYKYAFYTLIDNDPDKRAYLLPIVDEKRTGPRSKTIRAVQTGDPSPEGKYVFELAESDVRFFKLRQLTEHLSVD